MENQSQRLNKLLSVLEIPIPEWAVDFEKPSRYKVAFGGRGSGKSHRFAEKVILAHVVNPNCRTVCIREVQKSLSQSVKQLLEQKIKDFDLLHLFDIQKSEIRNKHGSGLIIFQGMQNHTADSIKSLEGFDIAWVEESQSLSQLSLDLLRPTIRKPKSEIWFTFNPFDSNDPVDSFFRGAAPPDNTIIKKVNWSDNPWFPDVLREEMEYDKGRDYDKYLHVWEGEHANNSEARVFKNWRVEEFEAPQGVEFYLGADWGFAADPTTLIRSYTVGRDLFIDYEAYMIGCEIVNIPNLFMTVPEAEKWPLCADSQRPDTISHVKKNGFPRIFPAVKGKGSIEDGVEWLKSYNIVVHPRCKHTIDELTMYSYKIDEKTDQILPIFEDKHNHVIDALRYAHEAERRKSNANNKKTVVPIPTMSRW